MKDKIKKWLGIRDIVSCEKCGKLIFKDGAEIIPIFHLITEEIIKKDYYCSKCKPKYDFSVITISGKLDFPIKRLRK